MNVWYYSSLCFLPEFLPLLVLLVKTHTLIMYISALNFVHPSAVSLHWNYGKTINISAPSLFMHQTKWGADFMPAEDYVYYKARS